MNKKGAQMGEVVIWLLRLVMVSILAIGIRTFMHTSAQYYESENSVFLDRILFSSESFMKYDNNFHQQYFFILDYDSLSDESYISEKLNKLFSSENELGIRIIINCEDKDEKIGYYNEEYYRSRRWFSLNFFVNELTLPILCESQVNNYRTLDKGTISIGMVSRFKMGQITTGLFE